tara:strand:+ start:299 stop:883 length:585 start_codon:yes stop_codon:yes gene_type:complete
MYIVGDIKTKEIIAKSGNYGAGTKVPTEDEIIANLAINQGLNPLEISILIIDGNSQTAKELETPGVEYEPVWNGSKLVDIDFSPTYTKKYISFTGNKSIITKGEDITFTGTVYQDDEVTIDTEYNETVIVTIETPNGPLLIRTKFLNGVSQHTLVPSFYGMYTLPFADKYSEVFRVKDQISFTVIYDATNELIL